MHGSDEKLITHMYSAPFYARCLGYQDNLGKIVDHQSNFELFISKYTKRYNDIIALLQSTEDYLITKSGILRRHGLMHVCRKLLANLRFFSQAICIYE